MKKYKLIRFQQEDKATLGKLLDENGYIICYTLEDPWKNNFKNISCIPEGVYKCVKHNGTKYQNVWKLLGVIGRSNILIHNGNYATDTQGCILVGQSHTEYKGLPMVNNSKNTLKKMRDFMPEEFELKIACEGFSNNLCSFYEQREECQNVVKENIERNQKLSKEI